MKKKPFSKADLGDIVLGGEEKRISHGQQTLSLKLKKIFISGNVQAREAAGHGA